MIRSGTRVWVLVSCLSLAVVGCEDTRGKVTYPPPQPRPTNLRFGLAGGAVQEGAQKEALPKEQAKDAGGPANGPVKSPEQK